VGKVPNGTSEQDIDDFFSEYGRLIDVFIPEPFRGCAFITYSAQEDATKALRRKHYFKGQQLRLVPAFPKGDKSLGRQENVGMTQDNYEQNPSFNQNSHENSSQKEYASKLTDMFLHLIQSRK